VSAPTAARRTTAQARWETRLLLRNGEQLLLTIVIPVGLLLGLALVLPVTTGPDRVAHALATVASVSIISAAFTSLAIATAFERRSGALRFLGTTPLTRMELLIGKLLATVLVSVISLAVVTLTAIALGWRPASGALWAVPVALLGLAAFAAWGMALAGALRAEAVLAVANGLFLVLIIFGGVIVPASSLPGPLATLAGLLPSGALTDAMTSALVQGSAPALAPIAVLAVWLAAGCVAAVRGFRWS
jgi:ABC-2 type transport system permease protein